MIFQFLFRYKMPDSTKFPTVFLLKHIFWQIWHCGFGLFQNFPMLSLICSFRAYLWQIFAIRHDFPTTLTFWNTFLRNLTLWLWVVLKLSNVEQQKRKSRQRQCPRFEVLTFTTYLRAIFWFFHFFFSILEKQIPKNYYFTLKINGIVNRLSLIEILEGNLLGIINHLYS